MQSTKSHVWWTEFFKAGAFLRLSDGQMLLWSGPFETCAEPPIGEKTPKFSVAYMNFFGSAMEFKLSFAKPVGVSVTEVQADLSRFQASLNPQPSELLKASDFQNQGYEDFEKTIQSLMGKIHRGELEKAVPVIFSRSKRAATVANLAQWMKNLLQTPDTLHAFGFWENGVGIMGATPEILFHRQEGKISTMALAGTMPRSEVGKRNSLLKDAKELHEHQLVVVDIQRQLGKWGAVRKSDPKILELPTLLHLQTLLEIENVNCGLRELVQQLHPTPALGVSPRAYGYHWLGSTSDQEGRRLFGAPILFSTPVSEVCLVAIRNIQWDQQGCRVGAGCGVVKESQPEQEWQELQQKANSVLLMLGMTELTP